MLGVPSQCVVAKKVSRGKGVGTGTGLSRAAHCWFMACCVLASSIVSSDHPASASPQAGIGFPARGRPQYW